MYFFIRPYIKFIINGINVRIIDPPDNPDAPLWIYRYMRFPSVSSQTNETNKLETDKHPEMAVFEVPLIANGLAAETGAGKAIRPLQRQT